MVRGIGNHYRGDDAAGIIVADMIKTDADIIKHDGEPSSLIESWDGRSKVLLIDAVSSGAKSGTIFHYDLTETTLPDTFSKSSTHAFGIVEAVELARALNKLPEHITFYGIEGKNFDINQGLSPEIEEALPALVQQITDNLKEEGNNNHA